jgi:PAS domain S-box-containing protein
MADWPARLQQTFNQILADSRPIALYWGSSYTTVYNEAFSKLCGSKHPRLLGLPVDDAWPDAGDQLREAMQRSLRATSSRDSVEADEWRFFVEQSADDGEDGVSWAQETYLKWSVVPIEENGQCQGFMHPVLETTSLRLWERRMKMLIDLGELLVTARDVKSYWAKTIEELGAVEPQYDIPLAILYSVEDDPDSSGGAKPEWSKICHLEGSLGVPTGHAIIPPTLALRSGDQGLSAMFREALRAQHPLLLQTRDGSLPSELLHDLQWRGFGDACRAAVVCPIRPTKEENVMGLLFLGLNPRLPYDNDYRQYISLLSQKLTTSLASTVLLEEEARRGRNMAEVAAYNHAVLKEELEVQTKEATESMQKFAAVAEFVPVGMCFGDAQGNIDFANDAWYRITGYPKEGPVERQVFLSCVLEEDREAVVRAWEQLHTTNQVTFEFRVRRRSDAASSPSPAPLRNSPSFERSGLDLVALDDGQSERHVLASVRAERAPTDGRVVRVLTCLTDVTLHKNTAEEAVRRAQQAENLKRMAEFATVGMYDMDLECRLLGANDVFFEMCGLDKIDPTAVELHPWELCVCDEDRPLLCQKLEAMVAEGKMQNVEVRLKTEWAAEDGASHRVVAPRWVQATLLPVRTTEGVIRSFTGCLSDVSLQRWQLEREKQRKEEALESKRQQENFIDMTSHEMRNPLSAIIQCADAVTGTLSKVQELLMPLSSRSTTAATTIPSSSFSDDNQNTGSMSPMKSTATTVSSRIITPRSTVDVDDVPTTDVVMAREELQLIESCIDNAETIVECAQHQKRIVDDILTMSKLDSKLLAVTPITVDAVEVVQAAIKMFEVEARRVDITLTMVVDPSFYEHGMTYLDFDPSRLKQVLINLLTNALKFTKSGPTRNVSLTMGASRTRPTGETTSVQFIAPGKEDDEQQGNQDQRPVSPRGPPIFLIFEVKDTGQGMTEDEKKSLFQRFVQASSRTHVKYGGSGLGLFISRRLTELQNGAIGVASLPGVGSTFAFYIETYVPSAESIKEAEAGAAAAREFAAATAGTGLISRRPTSVISSPTTAAPHHQQLQPPNLTSKNVMLCPSHGLVVNTLLPTIEGILVVEDNLINQQITRRGLIDKNYIVDVANHGMEALQKLRWTDRYIGETESQTADDLKQQDAMMPQGKTAGIISADNKITITMQKDDKKKKFPLSMILMDIEMPIQDGLTCTRHIRQMEQQGLISGGRIPIIAVSANARMEQILEAKAAGCDDVLVKPYRMPELIEKMNLVVARLAAAASLSPSTTA